MTISRSLRTFACATLALAAIAALAGCGTTHPSQLTGGSLSEAQTFPYYKLYWVGPRFAGDPLSAVDGRQSYNAAIGDSVYYGDCVTGKGLLGGGGSCALPLQITTVIYRLHSNAPLGPQRNAVIRGVPATIYDEGRSIEIYSGRVSIDLFSDTLAHAMSATAQLYPVNAPGSAVAKLAPPVYCPGLSGPISPPLHRVLNDLPNHPCQNAQAAVRAAAHLAETASTQ